MLTLYQMLFFIPDRTLPVLCKHTLSLSVRTVKFHWRNVILSSLPLRVLHSNGFLNLFVFHAQKYFDRQVKTFFTRTMNALALLPIYLYYICTYFIFTYSVVSFKIFPELTNHVREPLCEITAPL